MEVAESIAVHVYPAPLAHQSRILRIARTLIESGTFERIVVVTRDPESPPGRSAFDARCEALNVVPPRLAGGKGTANKLAATLIWSARALWALRGLPVACVNCHSLPVLPLCTVLKLWKRARLVYDTHELETETVGLGRLRRALSKATERLLIGFADEIAVVNASIGGWYARAYGRRAWVVENRPVLARAAPPRRGELRRELGVGDGELLFLYLGLLTAGRGVPLMLEVFSQSPAHHLVLIGYGDLAETVRESAGRCGRLHYRAAVPPEQVLESAAQADVGLSLIEPVCASYYLCLPNKIFEYLGAGIPVIASDFPEMSRVIAGTGCGWTIPPRREALAELVRSLDRRRVEEARRRVSACRDGLGWNREVPVLLEMYEALLGSPARRPRWRAARGGGRRRWRPGCW